MFREVLESQGGRVFKDVILEYGWGMSTNIENYNQDVLYITVENLGWVHDVNIDLEVFFGLNLVDQIYEMVQLMS